MAVSPALSLSQAGGPGVDQMIQVPLTVRKDPVQDHLRNLNISKSMGPEDMHARVLKELADIIAKPHCIILGRSWQSGEVPGEQKK